MKRTPFYEMHKAAGAKIVPFFGWEMPVQYKGLVEEHMNVRTKCGLFDVSHMGEIHVTGSGAFDAIQKLITNDLGKAGDGKALYTPMCYEDGGIVDDLIVYRFSKEKFIIVANASNIEKDYEWMDEKLEGVDVVNKSDETAQLALQGPDAQKVLSRITETDLNTIGRFCFSEIMVAGIDALVSRTGYTGEDGFELYFSADNAAPIWDGIMGAGKEDGLMPIGLGARDTLRLEAGLMLYGNDIDGNTTPLEVPLKWTVSMDKEFIGKKALIENERRKKLVGFELLERGVPRHGNEVIIDGENKGVVTSGTFSPTFKKPIGFCFVPPDHPKEKNIGVKIRDKVHEAKVTTTRFYRRDVK
ncbi:MAG: glycine cleavage system aminomethyltransferase GcvT [Candidatus Micrarchaeota archaeon]